jgi:anthranilate phosphoribosyltransferase
MTSVAALENGKIRTFELTPADFGVPYAVLADLKGGDGVANAAALRDVLSGARNAYRDISLANAAASLVIAGKAETINDGMRLATLSLDSGATAVALERLIAVSNEAD